MIVKRVTMMSICCDNVYILYKNISENAIKISESTIKSDY